MSKFTREYKIRNITFSVLHFLCSKRTGKSLFQQNTYGKYRNRSIFQYPLFAAIFPLKIFLIFFFRSTGGIRF